jgi:hypothetical protein
MNLENTMCYSRLPPLLYLRLTVWAGCIIFFIWFFLCKENELDYFSYVVVSVLLFFQLRSAPKLNKFGLFLLTCALNDSAYLFFVQRIGSSATSCITTKSCCKGWGSDPVLQQIKQCTSVLNRHCSISIVLNSKLLYTSAITPDPILKGVTATWQPRFFITCFRRSALSVCELGEDFGGKKLT